MTFLFLCIKILSMHKACQALTLIAMHFTLYDKIRVIPIIPGVWKFSTTQYNLPFLDVEKVEKVVDNCFYRGLDRG